MSSNLNPPPDLTSRLPVPLPGGHICSPRGFWADGRAAGFRAQNPQRLDLALLYSEKLCSAAGVFTQNLFCAAPVVVTRDSLKRDNRFQALLCNSGQANAGTGAQGLETARWKQDLLHQKLGLAQRDHAAVMSTGVIGVLPCREKIARGLSQMELARGAAAAARFSQAILTTDSCTKTGATNWKLTARR